jgi:hypothetical protein
MTGEGSQPCYYLRFLFAFMQSKVIQMDGYKFAIDESKISDGTLRASEASALSLPERDETWLEVASVG